MIIPRIWRRQPGDWFCVSMKDTKGIWKDWFFRRDEFKDIPIYVRPNRDKNVYACPHGFSEPIRDKRFAVLPKLLWADLDRVVPDGLELRPTLAFASSPGRYVGLWQTDRVVTEDLNRRLTYHVGADKSGWDLTQVLRVLPGTYNYKYTPAPMVRLLWDDGPTYRVKDLERQLPKLEATAAGKFKRDSAPPHVTRKEGERLAREYGIGNKFLGACGDDRSRACGALINRLSSKGASPEEIFAVLMISEAAGHYDWNAKRAWIDVLRVLSKRREAA